MNPSPNLPRATAPARPSPDVEALGAVLGAQVAACRALLDATRTVEQALSPLDLDALEDALEVRQREVRALEALDWGGAVVPVLPAHLEAEVELLFRLVEQVREADHRARAAAGDSLEELRRSLRHVRHGQVGMQGYRARPDHNPRFTDRRG